MDHLLEVSTKEKQKLIIPTPVIAEYLVRADEAGLEWLETLEKRSAVEVVPFDRMAAFETAQMDRAALGAGDKKEGSQEPWQKIKIDRQIIGVAKAIGCRACITSDEGLRQTARRVGIQVYAVSDLELPFSVRQGQLLLGKAKAKPKMAKAKPTKK
jgi:rRNA-processing protein FCF1